MNWYQLSAEETEQQLHVSHKTGLTYDQVLSYQNTFGKNIVEQKEKVSNWFIFIKQFQDFMVLILLGATLIAGLLGEFIDATAILVIVLINGFIGFFQEFRAENSLEKLRELSAPTTYVLREGHWERVPSAEIVVGDIIRLTRGDRISADVRIIKSHGLESEESALTGESIPITKETSPIQTDDLDPQDQTNMAFMGTVVSRGSGIGIVVQTGMNTMMGKIATLMTTTEQKTTPLENRLIHLGKILIVIVLALTAMIVAIGVIQGNPLYHMFLAGISLAVAAIPEGLPAIVTVALSLGVQRMIKRKSIVRKLSAVETLGCATIICSDKTGTITENEMTVKQIFLNDEIIHVSGDGYQLDGHFYQNEEEVTSSYPNLASMLTYGMICNHANIVIQKGKYKIDGDPTDGALLVAARKFGVKEKIREQFTIIKEIPFDARRKRMSMIVEDENKLRFLIVKGAPDVLLSKCRYVRIKKGQKELTDQTYYERTDEQMARRSLRTIAIAIKQILKSRSIIDSELENDLTLLGIYSMIDPSRKEVKQAIANCKKADIQTVMITGDHIDTAQAIATEIELLPKHGEVISGTELNNLSTAELKERVDNIYVYARVTPEHKLRSEEHTSELQSRGHLVCRLLLEKKNNNRKPGAQQAQTDKPYSGRTGRPGRRRGT